MYMAPCGCLVLPTTLSHVLLQPTIAAFCKVVYPLMLGAAEYPPAPAVCSLGALALAAGDKGCNEGPERTMVGGWLG